MYSRIHNVADKEIITEFFREQHICILGDASQSCCLIYQWLHIGTKAHDRHFTKMWIISAADKLIQRRAMTVGRINITESIEYKPERIDLAKRKLLHATSIYLETKRVARDQRNRITIRARKRRLVGETVTGVNPAIVAANKIAHHAMCILVAERTEHHSLAFELIVAIGIGEFINIRYTETDSAIGSWINSNWDVRRVAHHDKLVGLAVVVGVFEYRDFIGRLSAECWKRIFKRLRHPHASFCIEGDVHRLVDVGFRSKECYLEAFWDDEAGAFFFGSSGIGRADVFGEVWPAGLAVVAGSFLATEKQGNE